MVKTVQDILNAVDTQALLSKPLPEWRPILAEECQVYVVGENYLAKRFDAINYKFCEKLEAKEILVDNLYALLRYKYFPKSSEEIDDRITKIVSSFTANLKTTLKKVSFDKHSDANVISFLPDYCVAFRNGVYNFKDDKWFFRYNIIKLKDLSNTMYLYTTEYAIMWYLDYEFDSFGVDIMNTNIDDFILLMKQLTSSSDSKNYCFELMWNICHDSKHQFSKERFIHLCEILGYSILQSFSQHFIMMIGSGQNGKNSLFDGCLTSKLIPRPSSNDMDEIENDRFVTGSLENSSLNIFLETSAKTYTESKTIKALTGSMYQTIQPKGLPKYNGIINCKYIFAGNDQDKIKFSDNTQGFRRRINVFEIWYQWDPAKRFMKNGDYYDTTFSDSLKELKDDVVNTSTYVYFAMYGLINATKGFTSNFTFTYNDWAQTYSDIDFELKEKVNAITTKQIGEYMRNHMEDCKEAFFDTDNQRLYTSKYAKEIGISNFNEIVSLFLDDELSSSFFSEHDVYMSVKFLRSVTNSLVPPINFAQNIKKIYSIKSFKTLGANKNYIRVTFQRNRLKVLNMD